MYVQNCEAVPLGDWCVLSLATKGTMSFSYLGETESEIINEVDEEWDGFRFLIDKSTIKEYIDGSLDTTYANSAKVFTKVWGW